MKPDSKKNRQLLKQFPALVAVINEDMEPFGQPLANMVNDLTIKIQKADGDLMFKKASNSGLGDHSFVCQMSGKRDDQVMRRGEYVFAVGEKGIINRLDFPRNDDERRKRLEETYAWQVLWTSKSLNASGTGYMHSNPIYKETKYIVWVTVEAWHMNTQNDDEPESRFGKFCDRSVHVTVYQEPKEGFSKLQERSNVFENLYIDSKTLLRGTLDNDRDLILIEGMLSELCRHFQDEVYFNGMKDVLDKGGCRGASTTYKSVKILVAEMCGYDRVMLENGNSWVSFQLRPSSTMMYVLGSGGTLPQLRSLINGVVKIWNGDPKAREQFKPDKNVSVM